MKIVIAGGSGLVGKQLVQHFLKQGHSITILTRQSRPSTNEVTYVQWLQPAIKPESSLTEADVVINLAGTSINEGRWTKKQRDEIFTSRMDATEELIRIIHTWSTPPKVFINASAVGIYPADKRKTYNEKSTDVGNDFLAKTVVSWEQTASQLETKTRVVYTRFGVIFDEKEGALPLMVLPYKLFVGGTVGTGEQWLSWIHIEDVVRAVDFIIHTPSIQGPINLTAPKPRRMVDVGKAISKTMQRPHWLPVPSIAMKAALGKKSQIILTGQYVKPLLLLQNGFTFNYPTIEEAFQDLL